MAKLFRQQLHSLQGPTSSSGRIFLESILPFPWNALRDKTMMITLDHASHRNALTGSMMIDFSKIIETLEKNSDSFQFLILRGKNDCFSSGADFSLAGGPPKIGPAMSALMTDTCRRLQALPCISIAYLEKGAIGGGAELATATDFRIGHKTSFLQFVQSRMGLTPGWGGGSRLVQLIGRQQALKLFLSANKVNAQEALQLGMIDHVVQNEEQAVEWITSLGQATPGKYYTFKKEALYMA